MAKKKGKNHNAKKQSAEEVVANNSATANVEELPQQVEKNQQEPEAEVNEVVNADEEKSENPNKFNIIDQKSSEGHQQIEESKSNESPKHLENGKVTEETKEKFVAEDDSKEEIEELKRQLQLKVEESEKHKQNYDKLLSRVSQMKTIFQKMKESEARLEEVEAEKSILKQEAEKSNEKVLLLESSLTELNSEVLNLNSECTKLTQKNTELLKQLEADEFEKQSDSKRLEDENKILKKELKETKSDLEEYLILIQEEKSSKANLTQIVNDLKAKNDTLEKTKQNADQRCEDLSTQIEKLNKDIANLKTEEDKIVARVKAQLESKVEQLNSFTEEINDLKNVIKEKDVKLESLKELESNLKEKQLLVGKLRHEIIILNEHLNKAMKLIKRESGKETVDRELISNLFISFLQIPRGDNKKFEVLQLLANFLDWDDEKKRHAGLLSSGNYKSKSNSVVEVPTPELGASQSHSFVSLWTEFLEKESTPKDDATPSK